MVKPVPECLHSGFCWSLEWPRWWAVTTGAVRRAKLLSNRHHQQTDTQLFTGRMPFLSPNQPNWAKNLRRAKNFWSALLQPAHSVCVSSERFFHYYCYYYYYILGARDGQNLISWRWSLPLPTNPVWWGLMHAISSYRGNRPTNRQTGPITIHCATASAQCNNRKIYRLRSTVSTTVKAEYEAPAVATWVRMVVEMEFFPEIKPM